MKTLLSITVRVLVLGWVVGVSALAYAAAAATEATPASGEVTAGVQLSAGALSVIAGIVAVVGPAFWMLGRYEQRLTGHEVALVRIEAAVAGVVTRSIETGDRFASAIDKLADATAAIAERDRR